ncbi:MAG: lysophospholipid acyltransferase family protein, partial [Desulfopila sp.]
YLPDSGTGKFSAMMVKQMDTMREYLQAGGNLFVFPEGTRSRDGTFGELNTGALKVARLCRAPIYVLQVHNTDKLFTPGKFLFQSRRTNTISLNLLERIEPDYTNTPPTTAELKRQVLEAFSGGQS